jgi:hypothetical protein
MARSGAWAGIARWRRLGPAPLAVAALAALSGQPALADGAAVVAKLRSTTASLFDLSLARLEAEVNGDGSGHGYDAYVSYQDGEIVIFGSSDKAPVTEKACHGIIDAIKRAGSVDARTGKPAEPSSDYATLFAYPEIDPAKVDASYLETVDAMFTIEVTLGTAGDGKAITCRSKLLSPTVTYKRS